MKKIWVIAWRHSDGSGNGVTRAYTDQAAAQRDLAALNEHAMVTYELVEIELDERPVG